MILCSWDAEKHIICIVFEKTTLFAWFRATGMPNTTLFAWFWAAGMPETMQFARFWAAWMPTTTLFAWFWATEVSKTTLFEEGATQGRRNVNGTLTQG